MIRIKRNKVYELPAVILLACILCSCAVFGKVIKSEVVDSIPAGKYEKIIRLDTPDGMPIEPDAGFVYVLPEGKVTTDFPREIFVKNLDGLDKYAKLNQERMQKYIIRDSRGVLRGYYEILPQYRANLWEKGDEILVQIIIPNGNDNRINGDGGVGVGGHMPGSK